jgi:hypothetical protein
MVSFNLNHLTPNTKHVSFNLSRSFVLLKKTFLFWEFVEAQAIVYIGTVL